MNFPDGRANAKFLGEHLPLLPIYPQT